MPQEPVNQKSLGNQQVMLFQHNPARPGIQARSR
jgi:hypothetical protein